MPREEHSRRSPYLIFAAVVLSIAGCSPTVSGCGEEPSQQDLQVYQRSQPMMGTNFHIQVVSDDSQEAAQAMEAAFAEVHRVEALISEWRGDSELSEVNRRGAEEAVAVGPELFEVVRRGVEYSELTGGAFDITFASCGHLWSMSEERIPTTEEIERCLPRIDHSAVVVDEEGGTIGFSEEDRLIGLGGIGKGYGVDRAAEVLEEWGIGDYVVDGGGDMRVSGQRIDRPWSVGVAHPRRSGQVLATVSMSEGAVVTSGDYERSFERDGVLYHHIIDPFTGMPARKSVSVTVVAGDATTADALATGLFVMGPADGIELADEMEGVEALIVAPDLSVHRSRGFESMEKGR